MSLTSGSRLGHYEIVSSLGAGGMGEVYRARDSRLGRTVAIKVLRPELSENADARRRFELEARAVSSLNHPHIGALYDLGRDGNLDFLVLEHLEGQTLAERLKRGPLPLDESLRHAIEIMAALDGAHRCGVVHRDLKPGNIMLTKFGVKLLDFGLARLRPALFEDESNDVPARTASRTQAAEASVLGTIPYMSPEQLEGKDVDARSDLFSAGIVIYEMLTGRRPFEGGSSASVIAAILKSEPRALSEIRPDLPRALNRLVEQCLAKDRDERWQSAHDAGSSLRWIRESATSSEAPPSRTRTSSRWLRIGALVAGAGLVALITSLLVMRTSRAPSPRETIRFSFDIPKGTTLDEPYWSHPCIAPDGKTVAFVAISGGESSLWIRPLDAMAARPLPGTEGALSPFWSPDSRRIGFFADRKLKTVSPEGGTPSSICSAPSVAATGTWGNGGAIVFQINEAPGHDGLYRVSDSGGTPARIPLRVESGDEIVTTEFPHFLPNGRLLFLGRTASEERSIYLASIDSETCERVQHGSPINSRVEYAPPGFLVGVGENTLYALPFDARTGRVEGSPIAIAENVWQYGDGARFSVSDNDVLVYASAEETPNQLTWFDRAGSVLGTLGPPAVQQSARLSPDGRRLAVDIVDHATQSSQIWIFELREGIPSRMTSERSTVEFGPIWSPDGREIAFTQAVDAPPNLFRWKLGGTDAEILVPANDHAQWPCDWSPDGRSILYIDRDPNTRHDLWVVHLDGDREPEPWLKTQFSEGGAVFSPDGKWVAYVSDESGRDEVYVRPYGANGERRRISSAGGWIPRWRGDGKEVFYVNYDTEPALVSVPVDASSMEIVGAERSLFHLSAAVQDYDVTKDGERFLINHADNTGTRPAVHVVVHWSAGASAP